MFDYHLHSDVSFDSKESAERMVRAAASAGLKEICFTDHLDYEEVPTTIYIIKISRSEKVSNSVCFRIIKRLF